MFDFLFGWRKASKCKKVVKRLQTRVKILKKKRQYIVEQLREDIAQLLKNCQCDSAFSRVEQLFADQCLLASYQLLDNYCEFVIIHFPYIRRHKSCPDDISEAVSTLIYSAAWFGDLPELQLIQKLFRDRYGHKFTKAAVELSPGNLVNPEVIEKLCVKSAPHDVKIKLINEIANDYRLKIGFFWCDNKLKPDIPQGVNYKCNISVGQTQASHSKNDEAEESVDTKRSHEPKMILGKLQSQISVGRCGSNQPSTASTRNKLKIQKAATPSEILYQYHEKSVFIQEVEEFPYKRQRDEYGEDKRIFVFITSISFWRDQNYCKIMNSDRRKSKIGHQFCGSPPATSGIEELSDECQSNLASSHGSCSRRVSSCIESKTGRIVPYLGNVMTSHERPLKSAKARGRSSPSSSRRHVHPKLPDYDELVAKFRTLKEEYQQRIAAGTITGKL